MGGVAWMIEIILLSSGAGIIGTGLGGLIGLLFGESSKKTMSYLLSFASGMMVSIVCFDLVPEALELSNIWLTAVGIFVGVFVVQGLNYAIDKVTNENETHTEPEQLRHQDDVIHPSGKRSLLMSGLIMFAAIALHNLPEGLAIGSGSTHNDQLGLVLATLIALHNIPEGMSICVPLVAGGMKRAKALGLTALSGAPTLIGGLLGYGLGQINGNVIALSLSLAGGAMLYVTYCEILPQVILMNKGRRPAVFTIIGIVTGLIIVNLVI